MNKEQKFLAYLEALKTDKNSGLLEGVINGFKTLVEYRVDGNISERQVDIMESEEDMMDDMGDMEGMEDIDDTGDMDVLEESVEPRGYKVADVENMTWEEILKWNGMTVADFDARVKDWHPVEVSEDIAYWVEQVEKQADDFDEVYGGGQIGDQDVPLDESEGGVSEEENAATDEEPIMEVGEGVVKGKLNPMLLRKIDDAIEKDIQKMSMMIDRQKLVGSAEEKNKYLTNMRGQKWRDELISLGVDPSTMRGLIPALSESLDEANVSLLESVTILKMVVDKSE